MRQQHKSKKSTNYIQKILNVATALLAERKVPQLFFFSIQVTRKALKRIKNKEGKGLLLNQDIIIRCLNCDLALINNPFFYTLAKNSYMFGFFCSRDCAISSEYNQYMQNAYALKINATAESHRNLVLIPSLQTLKQFKEESKRRELRKKYF
jgi:hypothetical protein